MDIAHLHEIGEVDTHTIFIDSSQRDKQVFPTPAEYDICFDSPFQNVVGFDILDCSIPASTYIIDTHNNGFALSYRMGGTPGTTGRTLPGYLAAMVDSVSFSAVTGDAETPEHRVKIVGRHGSHHAAVLSSVGTRHVVYEREVVAHQVSAEFARQAVAVSGGTLFPVGRGTKSSLIVSQDASSPTGFSWAQIRGKVAGEGAPLATVDIAGLVCGVVTFADDFGITLYAYCEAAALAEVPLGDIVEIEGSGVASEFVVRGRSHSRVTDEFYDTVAVFVHEFYQHNLRVTVGNHDMASLATAISAAMPRFSPTGVDADLTEILNVGAFAGGTDFAVDRRILYRARDFFWFDMQKSSIADALGFSQVAAATDGDMYEAVAVPGNPFVFGARQVSAGSSEGSYELFSPGVTNLYGERFLVLRCPQIEEGGNASFSFDRASAGVGVFKLYNATLAHLRFDFTNLVRMDMHPIGKLSKLSLRFERVGGEAYNFRGADHHLFVAIKVLRPKARVGMVDPDRRLNRDYDPDVMKFLTDYLADDLDESSSEDDERVARDEEHRRRFVRARARRPRFA